MTQKWYVIGGEFEDPCIPDPKLIDEDSWEEHGPYEDKEVAMKVWRERSFAKIDTFGSRFFIVPSPPFYKNRTDHDRHILDAMNSFLDQIRLEDGGCNHFTKTIEDIQKRLEWLKYWMEHPNERSFETTD